MVKEGTMTMSGECRSSRPGTARKAEPSEVPKARAFGLTVHGKIDLWRGALAWLVVVCHAFSVATSVHPSARSLSVSQYALLDHTINAGFVWVMGFFVLSGYCIHQAVARRLSGPSFPLGAYLAARLTRILPLYYIALAFAVLVEPLIATTRVGFDYERLDLAGLLNQVFLVQNLTHHYGSFTPSWSLTNEVAYYLIYGLLASAVGRRRGWPLGVGLGLCLVVGGSLQTAYLLGYRSPAVLKTGLLFGLGVNWFLGVGVAVYREEIGRSHVALGVARAWPVVLGLAFAGYHLGMPIQFAYVVGGLAFALLLVRVVATPGPADGVVEPAWATKLVGLAGLSSYPTYLFHFPLMWLLAAGMMRWDLAKDWVTMMGVLVAASLAVGLVLGLCLERPIMKWRAGVLAGLEGASRPPRLVAASGFGPVGPAEGP
jgi:peptidoglycan/LPS O-acetylase OafA/YrhL